MRSLLDGLLKRDVPDRLGCMGRGALEVKEHSFFKGVDWIQVSYQKVSWIYSNEGNAGLHSSKTIDDRIMCFTDLIERLWLICFCMISSWQYTPPLIPPRGEVNAADAFDIGSFDEDDVKGIKVSFDMHTIPMLKRLNYAFTLDHLLSIMSIGLTIAHNQSFTHWLLSLTPWITFTMMIFLLQVEFILYWMKLVFEWFAPLFCLLYQIEALRFETPKNPDQLQLENIVCIQTWRKKEKEFDGPAKPQSNKRIPCQCPCLTSGKR